MSKKNKKQKIKEAISSIQEKPVIQVSKQPIVPMEVNPKVEVSKVQSIIDTTPVDSIDNNNKNKAFFSALSQAQEIHEHTPQDMNNVSNAMNGVANAMSVAEYKKQKQQGLSEAQLEAFSEDPRYLQGQPDNIQLEFNNITISNRDFLDNLHQANNNEEQIDEEQIDEKVKEEQPIKSLTDIIDLLLYLEKQGDIYIKQSDTLEEDINKYYSISTNTGSLDKLTQIILEDLMKDYEVGNPSEIGACYEYNLDEILDNVYEDILTYCKKHNTPEELEDQVVENVIDAMLDNEEEDDI